MNAKLYISNLSYTTTEDSLKAALSEFGEVTSVRIITDRETGRSRGFGFVEMSSEAEANAAIDMWHGKEFGGRMLTVNIARPKEDRPAGGGGGDRGGDRGPRREWSNNGPRRDYDSRQ